MKSAQELRSNLFATLGELEFGVEDDGLRKYLTIKLELLYDILGDEVPEEYWDRIEEQIYSE